MTDRQMDGQTDGTAVLTAKRHIAAATYRLTLAHARRTGHSLYFAIGKEMPPKLPLTLRGSEPLPNTWFSGPARVHIPNVISIGSSVLAQHTVMTNRDKDRWTDHTASVATRRIPSHALTVALLANKTEATGIVIIARCPLENNLNV